MNPSEDPRPPGGRVREKIAVSRALVGAIALAWIVHRIRGYPLEYLTRLDPEIWWIQIGTWLIFAAEGLGIGAAVAFAARLLRAAFDSAPPFPRAADALARALRSRRAPLVAGLLSGAAAAWVWGLHPVPIVHDEAAYLLQAKIFATGRWTAPAAPLPEFFEQMYVFVTPFTAAKYFPGFSLSLVPGVWLGLPVLMPLCFAGLSGGLLFSISRSIADDATAGLAWVLWTTTTHGVWQMPPFLSQHLMTALILGSWWALVRWRATAKTSCLLLVSACVGMGAITRPLTAVAAAVPIVIVVLRLAVKGRRWSPLAGAAALGAAFLVVIPAWSFETTGNWRVTPLALHVKRYTPYDGLGLGWHAPPPERPLPPDLAEVTRSLGRFQKKHTLRRLPETAAARLGQIEADALAGWRRILVPLGLYGLLSAGAAAGIGAVTAALNFAAYLLFAHPVNLTVYYVESYTVLAFFAALGITRAFLGARGASERPGGRASLALFLLAAATAAGGGDLFRSRVNFALASERKAHFAAAVQAIPGRAVVFVRYGRGGSFSSLVENGPDLGRQRIWLARDLGPANDRLLRIAGTRTPYLYLDESRRLVRLAPASKTSI